MQNSFLNEHTALTTIKNTYLCYNLFKNIYSGISNVCVVSYYKEFFLTVFSIYIPLQYLFKCGFQTLKLLRLLSQFCALSRFLSKLPIAPAATLTAQPTPHEAAQEFIYHSDLSSQGSSSEAWALLREQILTLCYYICNISL